MFFIFIVFLIHHWYILYSQPLLPGFDGGYYAVQVREILRSGTLYYSAPPIAFLIFAFFAKIFLLLNLFPPPLCVINGIKFGLALMKALCVFPIYLIFKQLTGRDYISIGGAVLFELHPFFMLLANGTSLYKNAVGIFFLLCYIYFVNRLLVNSSWRDIILALVFIFLTALTHILDFGLALAYTILYAIIDIIKNRKFDMRSNLAKLVVFELIFIGVLFIIIIVFIPIFFGTYYKFESFFEELLKIKESEGSIRFPPMFEPFIVLAVFLGVLGLIIVLQRDINELEKRILLSSCLILFFLISPVFSPQWYIRFIFVSFIPLILIFPSLFKLMKDARKAIVLFLIISLIFTPAYIQFSQARPVINPIELRDITNMAPYIPKENTIILTRFGLHYWVTWFLDVETSHYISKLDYYIQQYEHVFIIIEKELAKIPPYWKIIYSGKELLLIKVK